MILATLIGHLPVAAAAEKSNPVVIRPDAVKLAAGDPLSILTLVSNPAPLPGVRSWTIETARHRGWLYAMAMSPDGQQFATGGVDGMVRIWDVESGKLIRVLVGHNSYVFGLAWSPDGNTLASTGSFDGSVRLWDARSGRPLRTMTGEFKQYAQHVLWTPDGENVIATGDSSGRVSQWNVAEGKHLHSIEHGKTVNSVTCSADGKMLACSCAELAVQVWDLPLAARKEARTVGMTGNTAAGIAWAPDGKTLVFGNSDGKTYSWNRTEGKLRVFQETIGPYYLAWSPDGKTIALALGTGAIHLVDAESGKLLKSLPRTGGGGLSIPSGLFWSPDSKSLACGSAQQVQVWDVATAKALHTREVAASTRLQWSPGRPILSGIGDKTLNLWDAATLKRLTAVEGHTLAINVAAFSPKGDVLATGSADKTVRLWNASSGKLLHTLEGHKEAVNALAWSPDSLVVASGAADKTAKLWRAATGESLRTLEGHETPVSAVAWSPDSKILATADAQVVKLWKTDSWKTANKLEIFAPIHAVAWSRDSKWLATGDENNTIRIWNAATAKQRAALERAQSPSAVMSVAWSPDGRMLASGRGAFRMQLWDTGSSKLLHDGAGWSPVHRVTWSGATVAGANATSTVRFWNALTGQPRAVLVTDDDWLAFANAQGHLATTPQMKDGLVYIVQTDKAQDMLTPREFVSRFRWKNTPPLRDLGGK
jgi:WD40 repeat protein